MKLQKVPVLAAAFLVAFYAPALWAHGGGRFGGHGRFGGRGGHFGRPMVFAGGGGGYAFPFWWGMGGPGGYAWGYPSYDGACSQPAVQPSYYVNYSPYITTGALPQAAAPAVVAEQCPTLASGDLVGNVQRALRQRGFYNGPIDGVSGTSTREAIRAYAASCGLVTTGVIDSKLLASLGLL